MSIKSHISLIDLSQQLPFAIDAKMKTDICFGETLIVSCGHYEGDIEEEETPSEWTCEDSSSNETSTEVKQDKVFEVKDYVVEEAGEEEDDDDDDDFHFYFFPDCTKPPPPENSQTSIIVVDGMPKINPAAKNQITCTCKKDKTGECPCYMKLPCQCGAKTKAACTCSELKHICICHPGHPHLVCKCKGSDVCVCDPDGKIFPVCTCAKIEKPCICHPKKFPSPVCKCKHKPKLTQSESKSQYTSGLEENYEGEGEISFGEGEAEYKVEGEGEGEGEVEGKGEGEGEHEPEPCECQKPEPKKVCCCVKGKPCSCLISCICGPQDTCVCEPEEFEEKPCKPDINKTICSCSAPKVCTCGAESTGGVCKCFPVKICTCKNPENCKCFTTCDCTNPCICDTAPVKQDECVCLKTPRKGLTDLVCTCACKEETKKLKKVRAGKQGYRWCHEIDPRHTYFDYAYGKHEKVNYVEPEPEPFEISGYYGTTVPGDDCPVHGAKAPPYEKKARKPSIDCCSAVGGISICIETLGEDRDKFLVQMVSYSSKEGAKTGSKIVSILDCNLHTMEENRIEHITKKDITKERRNYMAICERGYYNKVTRICGDKHVVKRIYHTFDQAHDFILEGANLVFMRYIAILRYKGNIKTQTIIMDGTICESVYVSQGVSQGIVNGTPLFVVKIERHIIEPSGYVHQTLTVLTLKGYIVSHEWADNCYILHLNPLLNVIPEKDEIETHTPLRDRWREDLQLMSDFLDFKATRVSEGGRYVTESGALTGTVRDYLQAILLLRPQDTLHFTRHYFGAVLSALDIPHDAYFDPSSKHVRYYFFEQ